MVGGWNEGPAVLAEPHLGLFLWTTDILFRFPPSVPLLPRSSWASLTDSSLPRALGVAGAIDENQAQEGSCLPLGGAEMLLIAKSLPPLLGLSAAWSRASERAGMSQERQHKDASVVTGVEEPQEDAGDHPSLSAGDAWLEQITEMRPQGQWGSRQKGKCPTRAPGQQCFMRCCVVLIVFLFLVLGRLCVDACTFEWLVQDKGNIPQLVRQRMEGTVGLWQRPAWAKDTAVIRFVLVTQQVLRAKVSWVSPACLLNGNRAMKAEAAWLHGWGSGGRHRRQSVSCIPFKEAREERGDTLWTLS